ncbi:predicted protein [Histoplasma capsulatum G186AR]|uniref:Uncharacterized protein n=1 Tax=Ajellomyces capsulatus (strain G186AR / H82 / ATCC MYA-2454 / RMSCC 2432) TaxID=447093 RepID=C0P185_AJECG|nr:uncharacterized protein HCBG_09165 [Histoplasma capsulatum G186AR]EEH02600.1 predicted protein [Histoplasma capsulatum G186AR]
MVSCAPLTDSALFKPHSCSVHFGLGIELSKAFESVYVLNGPSSSHVPYPLDLDNNSPMHPRTMEEIQELVRIPHPIPKNCPSPRPSPPRQRQHPWRRSQWPSAPAPLPTTTSQDTRDSNRQCPMRPWSGCACRSRHPPARGIAVEWMESGRREWEGREGGVGSIGDKINLIKKLDR